MMGVGCPSSTLTTFQLSEIFSNIPLLISTDVMTVGPWSILKELKDANFWKWAEVLPKSLLQSRATSTTQKSSSAGRHGQLAINCKPSQPILVLYLKHLCETEASKSVVEETVNGLTWAHSMAGIPLPTISPFIQATLEGTDLQEGTIYSVDASSYS